MNRILSHNFLTKIIPLFTLLFTTNIFSIKGKKFRLYRNHETKKIITYQEKKPTKKPESALDIYARNQYYWHLHPDRVKALEADPEFQVRVSTFTIPRPE